MSTTTIHEPPRPDKQYASVLFVGLVSQGKGAAQKLRNARQKLVRSQRIFKMKIEESNRFLVHKLGSSHPETAAFAQKILILLLHLNCQIKQAHWNIEGAEFLSFHKQLDEFYDYFEDAVDEIAERIRALGEPACGSPQMIVRESNLGEFPDGTIAVNNAMKILSVRLNSVSQEIRNAMKMVEDLDLITHDMMIALCSNIEKFRWLVDSQIVVSKN